VFKTIRDNQEVIIQPETDITSSTISELRGALKDIVAEGAADLTFDLINVEVIDSIGLGMIISTHNSMNKTGGKLKVINASPEVLELFRSMRLDRHFSVTGA
jgi:anti-sigma B factor antagonist